MFAVFLAVSSGVATVTITGLYQVGMEREGEGLRNLVDFQSALWVHEAERHLAQDGLETEELAFQHVAAEFLAASAGFTTFAQTGEFTVAEARGDSIHFLVGALGPAPAGAVALDGLQAVPQQRALAGESGVEVLADYRGTSVLAAYGPVDVLGHRLGIVAKIDVAEVRAPYVRMGWGSGLLGLLFTMVGMVVIRRLGSPLLRQLEASERKYRGLVEGAPDAIILATSAGRILEANPAAGSLFGYSHRELVGMPVQTLYADAADRPSLVEILGSQGAVEGLELGGRTKDGRKLDLLVSSRSAHDPELGGEVFESVVRDISARKLAQREAEAARADAEMYLEVAEVMMVALDANGRVEMMNRKACEVLGCPAEGPECSLVGVDWFETCLPDDDAAEVRGLFEAMIYDHDGAQWDEDFRQREGRVLTRSGEERLIAWYSTRMYGDDVEVIGTLASGIDVTEQRKAEEAAARAAEAYRRLHDNMLDGFALHELVRDDDGVAVDYVFVAVNPAFERQTGLREEDIIGRRVMEVIPDLEPHWIETYARVVETGEPVRFDSWAEALGRHYEVQAFRTGPGEFGTIVRDVSGHVATQRLLSETSAQLRRLALRTEMVREEERRTLARELHDGLGQALTAMHMDLSMAAEDLNDPEMRQRLEEVMHMSDDAVRLTQSLSTRLRPPVLDLLGLGPAIRGEAEQLRRKAVERVHVDVPEGDPRVPPEVRVALFRIVQEALTNVVRHAHASQVWIRLRIIDGRLLLEVSDDGAGIDLSTAWGPESLGLVGMRERAWAIGADFAVENRPEGGVCVRVAMSVESMDDGTA